MNDGFEVHRTRTAFRAALIAAMLSAVGWPLDLLISRQLPEPSIWSNLAASLASALLVAWLLVVRRRITTAQASAAFVLNSAIVAVALWFSNQQYALQAPAWAPFQANKLGVFTVALLAPELWAGLSSIAVYTLSAALQWQLFDAGVHERAAVGEPGAMLVYGLFAAALLVQVRRRFRADRELVRVQQEAEALSRTAYAMLAIRDYANTPLQTLMLRMAVMRMQHPEVAHDLAVMQRALDRLAELNQLLSRYDTRVRWRPGDEALSLTHVLASLDPERRRGGRADGTSQEL
jgi:hypothetical protein